MKNLRKSDIILILSVGVIALLIYLFKYFQSGEDLTVAVYADNALYGRYSLDEDEDITVSNADDINIISIKDGRVSMESASCPDCLCVKQQSICMAGESICCLPNKVLVVIESKQAAEYDAITK